MEYILTPEPSRQTVYPIRHEDLWKLYKQQLGVFWTTEEIDFEQDRDDFERLSKPEQEVLKSVFAFFAVADGIVMKNLGARFCQEVQVMEAQFFYKAQDLIESVHAECYALIIETIIADAKEKHQLFHALTTMDHVRRKADFANKYMAPTLPFGERLVAFAAVEGILFSASFAIIYHFKSCMGDRLKGLVFSNELISRDEGLHTLFASTLFGHLQCPPTKAKILAIIQEAVEVECLFVNTTLKKPLRGLTSAKMCRYVKVVGDMLLSMLGCPKHWHAKNPLHYMMTLGLDRKTNFFEVRSAEYQKQTKDENMGDAFDLTVAF